MGGISEPINPKTINIRNPWLYLPFIPRLVIYSITLIVIFTGMFLNSFFLKQHAFLVLGLVPIVMAGWLFNYKMVIVTTLFISIVKLVVVYGYLPEGFISLSFPYIAFNVFYMIMGLITFKGIKLYKELDKELLQRKAMEGLLENERNWFRISLLSIGDGIITLDESKKIIFMNYEAERLTGWTLEEATNKKVSEVYKIINEETREGIADPIARIQARGFVIGLANHTILISKNAKEISIGDSGAPIKDKEQNLLGYIIIFRDVSHKKKMEKHLKEVQAHAIQSEKLAGIGQLAAGIAHEINNPLGYINSNIDTLSQYIVHLNEIIDLYRSVLDVEKKEIKEKERYLKIDFILKDIALVLRDNKDGINRITAIVKNLKDLARINPNVEWEDTNINNLLENVLLIAHNEVKYTADIDLQLDNTIPKIFCNKSEISQVFLNILLNAAYALKKKFTNTKGKIVIRTKATEQHLVCEIEDNGCGIPESIVSRIFEPFFTTKDPGDGTGLGLHIAYDIIVLKHKGGIQVKSKEGEGARFILQLPFTKKQ
jgi:PAS domain S-box-containing protein